MSSLNCPSFAHFPPNLHHFWENYLPFRCDAAFWIGLDMTSFSSCDVVVDVSCSTSAQFIGAVEAREHVDMKLCDFSELFLRRQAAQATAQSSLVSEVQQTSPYVNLYLAQVTLLSSDPSDPPVLLQHYQPATFPGALAQKHLMSAHLWANIGQASTSLHYDAYHNFLTVMAGCKRVRLLPPHCGAAVGLRPAHSSSANHAHCSYLSSLLDRASAFYDASLERSVVEVDIKPGQSLFIPEGWWHEVQSESCTLAVVKVYP